MIDDLTSLLKNNGIIYLSTPNKYSLINIISDPHWGMPLISLFNRNQIKKYFLRNFRKSDYQREDVAELLSLKKFTICSDNIIPLKSLRNFLLHIY